MTITQQDKVSPDNVFLNKLDVPYSKLYEPRGARLTEQHSEDMVLAFNSRIAHRLTVHAKKCKIKRRSRKPSVSSLRVARRSRSRGGFRNSCFQHGGGQGGQIDNAGALRIPARTSFLPVSERGVFLPTCFTQMRCGLHCSIRDVLHCHLQRNLT